MFLFFLAQFLQKKVFIIRCPLFYHIDLKEKLERTQEECSGLQEKHDSEPHEFNPSLLIPCFFFLYDFKMILFCNRVEDRACAEDHETQQNGGFQSRSQWVRLESCIFLRDYIYVSSNMNFTVTFVSSVSSERDQPACRDKGFEGADLKVKKWIRNQSTWVTLLITDDKHSNEHHQNLLWWPVLPEATKVKCISEKHHSGSVRVWGIFTLIIFFISFI